jgi:hypothetical protein
MPCQLHAGLPKAHDFRDYITVFPDRLFSPVSGATRQGMLHQFTPMFSVGYNF